MFKNILLAVDGSEHANRAAEVAADLARNNNAKLYVVVAFDPVPAYLGEPHLQVAIASRLQEAEQVLARALELIGPGIDDMRSEVLEGSPAEAILNVASVRQPDLIVMGSRGLGRLSGLLLGSQSQKVVSHATCPVLIVR